jgi:predicted PurR-regulated permease PerM
VLEVGQIRARLLAVTTTILVIAALKLGQVVILPLVTAMFLIILIWPVYAWLEKYTPRWVAFLGSMLALLLVLGVFVGLFALSASQLAEHMDDLRGQTQEVAGQVKDWAERHNLPVPGGSEEGASGLENATPFLMQVVRRVQSMVGLLALVVGFLMLGLLEVNDYHDKIRKHLHQGTGDTLLDVSRESANRMRRYILALTLTCIVSGVASGVFALIIGLKLALLWGLLSFLLNYIPTLGPLVAVFPPTLFALLDSDGYGFVAGVFLGMGAIQFLIGNFIDPKIEGWALALSPVAVLLAIVFWGWLWGVLGALLAVPITMVIVIVCQQFEQTKWIAALLSEKDKKSSENENKSKD